MVEHRSKKERLDAAGRAVIRGALAARPDIDGIVADPQLFDRVRARISAGPLQQARRRGLMTPVIGNIALVGVIAGFVIAGIAGLRSFDRYRVLPNIAAVQVPDGDPVPVRPDNPPKPTFSKLPSGRTTFTEAKSTTTKRVERRAVSNPDVVTTADEPAGNFYAVSFSPDGADMTGARIVRVNMPRASLFAMGINIPIENDREVIRADLLIGSDGSTRAVRIVDQY